MVAIYPNHFDDGDGNRSSNDGRRKDQKDGKRIKVIQKLKGTEQDQHLEKMVDDGTSHDSGDVSSDMSSDENNSPPLVEHPSKRIETKRVFSIISGPFNVCEATTKTVGCGTDDATSSVTHSGQLPLSAEIDDNRIRASVDSSATSIITSKAETSTAREMETQVGVSSEERLANIFDMKNREHQQELREQLRQVNVENTELAIQNERLTRQLLEMRRVLIANEKLTEEKTHLEKKVGDLIWEKAGLYSKVQNQTVGEVRCARRAAELSSALLDTQEEVHRLATQQQQLQGFVDSLLATLGSLGFNIVTDSTGRRIPLDLNLSVVQALDLEPKIDDYGQSSSSLLSPITGSYKKTRRSKPSDKWYKAMLAAQEETIMRLQDEVRVLESSKGSQQENAATLHQLQKALHAELERNRTLERQIQHLTKLLEIAPDLPASEGVLECAKDVNPSKKEETCCFNIQQLPDGEVDYTRFGARSKQPMYGRRRWLSSSPILDNNDDDTTSNGGDCCNPVTLDKKKKKKEEIVVTIAFLTYRESTRNNTTTTLRFLLFLLLSVLWRRFSNRSVEERTHKPAHVCGDDVTRIVLLGERQKKC